MTPGPTHRESGCQGSLAGATVLELTELGRDQQHEIGLVEVQGVADRGDEFAGRLLLPSLNLGEISQGHAGIRGDFAQGTTLRETLLPECLAQKFT